MEEKDLTKRNTKEAQSFTEEKELKVEPRRYEEHREKRFILTKNKNTN